MRRIAGAVIAAIALALGGWQLWKAFLAPAPAAAASAAAHKAADRFVTLAKGSEISGKPPRAADPAAGPLLALVFNLGALPATPPPFAKLDPINDWVLSAARVGQVYILAGTGATGVGAGADSPAVEARAEANVAAFAPEVGRYMDTQNALMRLEAASVAKFAADDPADARQPAAADGLVKLRAGAAQSFGSMLSMLATSGVTPDWRRARAQSLLAAAPDIGKLLAPADASRIAAEATSLSGVADDPVLKADLAQVAAAIVPPAPAPARNLSR